MGKRERSQEVFLTVTPNSLAELKRKAKAILEEYGCHVQRERRAFLNAPTGSPSVFDQLQQAYGDHPPKRALLAAWLLFWVRFALWDIRQRRSWPGTWRGARPDVWLGLWHGMRIGRAAH